MFLNLLSDQAIKEFQEEEYCLNPRHLTLVSPPSGRFTLEIVTEILPQKNTSLEVKTILSYITLVEWDSGIAVHT